MKKFILLITFAMVICQLQQAQNSNELYVNNRAPLLKKPFMELPIGAIRPQGWLQDQLLRMKSGMTGNLDVLYEKVMGKRNGWLGGDGDVWERGPYWIDGLLPLAYILNDKQLKEKVKPWVEWTLKSQQPNGYFGPYQDRDREEGLQRNNARDWWPKMVVLKFMKQYYDATSDKRVIPFMLNYFRYQLQELPNAPLNHWTDWGQQRGGDNLMIVYWLYNLTGESFLLDLGDLITQQTTDWTTLFQDHKTLYDLFSIHGVNLAQAMKQPIIRYQATGKQEHITAIDQCKEDLMRAHGWPIGLYGADEMLHTGNPTQGSELCSAVELMFSLEKMIEITGRTDWADWLEKITFNALPTQITDDFDARQYYQQLNQVEVSKTPRNFMTCYHGTGQLFGLLTGYPCCTSNLHQGWPKFTQNLWFASEDRGLAAIIYSPSEVTARVAQGTLVKLTEDTQYPFEETIRFHFTIMDKKIKNVEFPLHLRIPTWCKNAVIKINGQEEMQGKGGDIVKVLRTWKTGDLMELLIPMHVSVSNWYEKSAVVERGPLVYALRIGEKWEKESNEGKYKNQYGDTYYQVLPTSPWNYCLPESLINAKDLDKSFSVEYRSTKGYPWNLENAPVEIHTKGKRIPEWKIYNGSAGPLPYSVQYQAETLPEEDITLIPYGCTTLRITEFPITTK
jgi:hypothetical protein